MQCGHAWHGYGVANTFPTHARWQRLSVTVTKRGCAIELRMPGCSRGNNYPQSANGVIGSEIMVLMERTLASPGEYD